VLLVNAFLLNWPLEQTYDLPEDDLFRFYPPHGGRGLGKKKNKIPAFIYSYERR